MEKKITVLELLNTGWDWYKKNILLLLAVGFTIFAFTLGYNYFVNQVGQWFTTDVSDEGGPSILKMSGALLFWALFGLLAIILAIGQNEIYLKISRGETPKFLDLFTTYKPFVSYAIMGILYTTSVGFGLLFFIIPGVIVMTIFMFAPYFVIEKGMGPIESLKESIKATKEERWALFRWVIFGLALLGFFFVAISLLNLPAFLMTLIGCLLFNPVLGLGNVFAYRKLVDEKVVESPPSE